MKNGKLIHTLWHPADGRECCYTCQYYDMTKLTPATIVRTRVYDRRVINTFFCATHGQDAKIAEEAN